MSTWRTVTPKRARPWVKKAEGAAIEREVGQNLVARLQHGPQRGVMAPMPEPNTTAAAPCSRLPAALQQASVGLAMRV
jgi:hypothetical protein